MKLNALFMLGIVLSLVSVFVIKSTVLLLLGFVTVVLGLAADGWGL